MGPEINIYESVIEDDLWHKGVRKILFMNTSRVCLAMSKDLEACKIDLNSQMKVLATDLRTLEEIALGDKKYKRLESDAVSWKGKASKNYIFRGQTNGGVWKLSAKKIKNT